MKMIAAAVLVSLSLAAAAAVAGDTPVDPFSGLQSGKKSFEAACSRCHKLDLPLSKRLDRPAWEKTFDGMVARGASFAPAERALIVDYLVVKSTFETKCSACHGLEGSLASKRTRDAWLATVKRMAGKSPQAFTAAEIDLISAYLTLAVGSE